MGLNRVSQSTPSEAIGQAQLSSGSVTVNTSLVSNVSFLFLTHAVASGTLGTLSVGNIVNGKSFVINSSSGSDNSKVNWTILG